MNRAGAAGGAAVLGGVALIADLALHLFSGWGRAYFAVASLMGLCLAGAPLGLWPAGAVAPRWRAWAMTGTGVTLLGILAWLVAFVTLAIDPGRAFSQKLTPAGSLAMAVGMLVLGVAVVRSHRFTGWRAWAPVAVGLYFPLQLVAQLVFFLGGRDDRPGPDGLLLGLWGALWAAVGVAVLTTSTGSVGDEATRRRIP
jgi:hypothetical protein